MRTLLRIFEYDWTLGVYWLLGISAIGFWYAGICHMEMVLVRHGSSPYVIASSACIEFAQFSSHLLQSSWGGLNPLQVMSPELQGY